jgi:hypothetical protein
MNVIVVSPQAKLSEPRISPVCLECGRAKCSKKHVSNPLIVCKAVGLENSGPIPELRFYVDKLPVNIRGNTVRLSFEPRIPPVPIDTRVYVVDHDSKIPVHDSLGSFIYARTLKDIIELRSEFIVPYVETAPHIMPGIICLNPLRINLQVDTL